MVEYILFVCIQNSARSQMAEGFFNFYNQNENYIGISAGTEIATSIKTYAIKAMKEKGIDISNQKPKLLNIEMGKKAKMIITMGCIKGCPLTPKEKTIDWNLKDPKTIDDFRNVRDDIENKVKELILKLK